MMDPCNTDSALPYGLDRRAILTEARKLSVVAADSTRHPLLTRRMTLRTWSKADDADLLALDADPRVTQNLIDQCAGNPNEALAFMAIANALCTCKPGFGLWRAGTREDDRFLGYFLLVPGPTGHVEIGARLVTAAWGRGYALEGSRFLTAHGIETLHLPEIWGFCHPDNRAVPVLLRRLHFIPLGETMHLGCRALAFRLDADTWLRHRAPAPARAVMPRTTSFSPGAGRPATATSGKP